MNETEVPDLYRLAFIPGSFRCPKCGFVLTKTVINVTTGETGTREQERQGEPCPNDGTDMVHVTYKEQCEYLSERLIEELEWRRNHRECGGGVPETSKSFLQTS